MIGHHSKSNNQLQIKGKRFFRPIRVKCVHCRCIDHGHKKLLRSYLSHDMCNIRSHCVPIASAIYHLHQINFMQFLQIPSVTSIHVSSKSLLRGELSTATKDQSSTQLPSPSNKCLVGAYVMHLSGGLSFVRRVAPSDVSVRWSDDSPTLPSDIPWFGPLPPIRHPPGNTPPPLRTKNGLPSYPPPATISGTALRL